MSDNIEDKIKDVIKNKLHTNGEIDDNTMDLINKLYEIFPNLKEKQRIRSKNSDPNTVEVVLDEIVHNNVVYYKDRHGGVWNDKAELVGVSNNDVVTLFQ